MEERCGQGVRMSDIARFAGVSRQALYLHFDSRLKLMVATTQHVDQVLGLDDRLQYVVEAPDGGSALTRFVDLWGRYIPEIYGLAKALLASLATDNDAKEAWSTCMSCLRDGCDSIIHQLMSEDRISEQWTAQTASDWMFSMLSIEQWEQLTIESKWSIDAYVDRMTWSLKQSLLSN